MAGVLATADFALAADLILPPLAPDVDLKLGSAKHAHAAALLACHDLTADEYASLRAQHDQRALTELEALALERYVLRAQWGRAVERGALQTFEEFVRLKVVERWDQRVESAALVLGPKMRQAVRDEADLVDDRNPKKRRLQTRDEMRHFLQALPDFSVQDHLIDGAPYRVTRAQLDDGRALARQERRRPSALPSLSKAAGVAKRTISNANKALRMMGCRVLEPGKRKRHRSGPSEVQEWTLPAGSALPVWPHVELALGLRASSQQEALPVVVDVEWPVFSDDQLCIFDRKTGEKYPLPHAPYDERRILCRDTPDLQGNLSYGLAVALQLDQQRNPGVRVESVLFHRGLFVWVVHRAAHTPHILNLLDQLHVPQADALPATPSCRVPRVRLVGGSVEDISDY